MKSSLTLVFILGLAVFTAGYVAPRIKSDKKYVDREFVLKQKVLFDVLRNIYTTDKDTEYYKDASNWNFDENYDKFTKVDALRQFMNQYRVGMLRNDEVFSIMYEKHRNQAICLFNVYYYAKDWDTFYKSLIWSVYNKINRDMIIYALTVAVIHRKDMYGIELPAPYEINPYYFFNSEVIEEARWNKLNKFEGVRKTKRVFNEPYEVIIPTNYTNEITNGNKLSYFTKDVGLNSYYYYFHTDYPFWMGGYEFKLFEDRRGELYLFEHQQFLARYYLERLSNGLGEIPEFSSKPVEEGYNPHLRYYNGRYFPARPNMYEYDTHDFMQFSRYEMNIQQAIDYGYITFPDGSQINLSKPESIDNLGNFMQGNEDWPYLKLSKYLPVYAQILLGSTMEHNDEKYAPSVLEHYETAMSDPLFYMLYKRLMKTYWQFKDELSPYTENELGYENVKIESVEMDKLVTYFNAHDVDITNAVKIGSVTKEEYYQENYLIKARQIRLNNIPFTFKIKVSSKAASKSVVRVFLGPKYDENGHLIDLNNNRENFWLMDTFMHDLKSGENIIDRKSKDFPWFVPDRLNLNIMREEVIDSLGGGNAKLMPFNMNSDQTHCGFPDRLMLPKGSKGGMPFQFFFIITPYVAPKFEQYSTYDEVIACGIGSGSRHIDALSFGYPFDRKIDELEWYTPNMYYYDTMIFHKDDYQN